MSILAAGIGVIVQSLRLGPLGSGYLCPQVFGPSYVQASILAASTGGLSLLCGMTLLVGLFEEHCYKGYTQLMLKFYRKVLKSCRDTMIVVTPQLCGEGESEYYAIYGQLHSSQG